MHVKEYLYVKMNIMTSASNIIYFLHQLGKLERFIIYK